MVFHSRASVLLLSGLLLCTTALLRAQRPPAQGLLTGTVGDPSGAKLAHAQLHITGGGQSLDTVSDAVGRFSIALPAGIYNVSFRAGGFQVFETTVQVSPAATVRLDPTLQIAPVVQELTIPETNAGSTAAADNASALVFQGPELDTFSADDATFQKELLALAGGVQTPEVFINGFSGGRFPPKNSILSVRINRNPYSAQYDSQGFGHVEITTKPGGGPLHGQLNINATDNAFNAQNPYIVGGEPPYYQLALDGNLSGGLGGKTSFFLSGDLNDQQNNAALNAVTLTNNQPTPFSATVHDPQVTSVYSLRIARQLTPANSLDTRYEFSQSNLTNGGLTAALTLPSQAFDSGTTNQTLQMIDTQIFGPHIVSEGHFQYIRTRLRQDARSNAPALLVEGSFSGGGNPAQSLHDNQDRYELQELLSVDRGAHYLRFGARYRLQRDANLSSANYNGQFTFASLAAFAAQQPSQFTLTTGRQGATLLTGDLGAYAEDEWKLSPHITFDAGLRLESQSAIPDHLDLAPRLGAAWALYRKRAKTPFATLRVGGGIFYDRFAAANILTAVRQNGISQQTFTLANPAGYPNLPSTASLSLTPPTLYRISPNLKSEYTWNGGVTLEKTNRFGRFSVNYIAIRGVHQWGSRNINAPLPGTYNPALPTGGVRPLGGSQNIYQFDSEGTLKTQSGFINARIRLGKRVSTFINYSYSHTAQDVFGAAAFASNSYNLTQDFGRAAAPSQLLFTGANVLLPLGVSANLFLSTQGGVPFNITTGTDLNGDSLYNDRPAFATAPTASSVVYNTRFGSFDANPQPGEKIIPINYGNSPNFVFLDMFVSRSVKFGPRPPTPAAVEGKPAPPRPDPPYQLSFSAEASNLLNHKNPGPPVGVLGSPLFGQSVSVNNIFTPSPSANRTVFLQTTFTF